MYGLMCFLEIHNYAFVVSSDMFTMALAQWNPWPCQRLNSLSYVLVFCYCCVPIDICVLICLYSLTEVDIWGFFWLWQGQPHSGKTSVCKVLTVSDLQTWVSVTLSYPVFSITVCPSWSIFIQEIAFVLAASSVFSFQALKSSQHDCLRFSLLAEPRQYLKQR